MAGDPVDDEGLQTLGQVEGHPGDEMGGGEPLVLAGVEGHGPPQPPWCGGGHRGTPPQGDAGEALPPTELAGFGHLPTAPFFYP